jgi:hypothetical protein
MFNFFSWSRKYILHSSCVRVVIVMQKKKGVIIFSLGTPFYWTWSLGLWTSTWTGEWVGLLLNLIQERY